jgi:RNA polymerase sigma factor (sigma-70 family)
MEDLGQIHGGPFAPDSREARLDALVRDYAKLVRHAIRVAGGQKAAPIAEDIEQNVFLSLWQQVRREQNIDHPVSYIYQAAVRETVRAVRRLYRHPEVSGEPRRSAAPPGPTTPEQAALAREQQDQIGAALETLALDRGRAVRAHLRGFTVQEIMTLFGWDYQKARNLITRGMADLREALREAETR